MLGKLGVEKATVLWGLGMEPPRDVKKSPPKGQTPDRAAYISRQEGHFRAPSSLTQAPWGGKQKAWRWFF